MQDQAINQQSITQFLVQQAFEFRLSPYRFVMFAWDHLKLHPWQKDILLHLEAELTRGELTQHEAIQLAVASGHGIGKSCLVALLTIWAMVTSPDTRGIITANTESQLRTKTWAELAKWFTTCKYKKWFKLSATSLVSANKEHEKTWRIDAIAWSENNPEAFAGMHNAGKRILLIFDEASAIADSIWEVSKGALTDQDTQIIWVAFGNPTRNIGQFASCFDGQAHRWNIRHIDSRDVGGTNLKLFNQWAADYGEDSDFFRVRVRGLFPRSAFNSILGAEEIDESMKRSYPHRSQDHAAIVLGVDVARQGDDATSIAHRQGKCISPIKMLRVPDIILVAQNIAQWWSERKADACFVDETGGYGAGVVDSLRTLNRDPIGVQFAGKPADSRYFNKRSEMYFELAKWVRAGGQLPFDKELREELLATSYTFAGDKFKIVSKEDIKEELGRSPDKADAVALTFAFPVHKKADIDNYRVNRDRTARGHDPLECIG